jgi:hypothetical protein
MTLGPEIRQLEIPWAPRNGRFRTAAVTPGPSSSGGWKFAVAGRKPALTERILRLYRFRFRRVEPFKCKAPAKSKQGNNRCSNELDGLKTVPDVNIVIPIRSRERQEAELIETLSHIADWTVLSSGMPEGTGNSRLFAFTKTPASPAHFCKTFSWISALIAGKVSS